MNKYKKLVGNSFIFAIGNLGSKLMQFIMVPLYSYTLTTTEYGKVDLLTTIISLVVPIISCDIFDAVFRFALDKTDDHEKTFNTGLAYIIFVSCLSVPFAFILQHFIRNYPIADADLVLIATMLFSLISNYARAIGKIRQFAVGGIINSLVMGGLNFVTLLYLHWHMTGYLLSMSGGMICACFYFLLSCGLLHQIHLRQFSQAHFTALVRYSLPLVPNLLAWWLNSASDRLFILYFIGISANGIYAMASKIPNILSILMSIFLQSWQISVVQEFSSPEGKEFITKVFRVFVTVLFMVAIALVMLIKPLFRILVSPAYYVGWQVAPLLIYSILYSNISGFIGTIYTATKQTVPIMYTTVVGAIVNVILSFSLVPTLKLNGAALANILSFMVVSVLRARDILKQGKIVINWRNLLILNLALILSILPNYLFNSWLVPLIVGSLILLWILIKGNGLNDLRETVRRRLR